MSKDSFVLDIRHDDYRILEVLGAIAILTQISEAQRIEYAGIFFNITGALLRGCLLVLRRGM